MPDLLKKIYRGFLLVIQRTLFLYIVLGAVMFTIIDQEYVSLKTLDYLQGTAGTLVAIAREDTKYDYQSLRNGVRYYKHFYKLYPDNTAALTAIAFCYNQLGSKAKAIAYYQKAVKQQPDLFGAYHNLGLVYYETGNFAEAVEALRQAVAIPLEKTISVEHRINPYDNNYQKRPLSSGEVRVLGIRKAYATCYRYLVLSYQKLGQEEQARTAALMGLKYTVENKDFFTKQLKRTGQQPTSAADREERRMIYYPPIHAMEVNGKRLLMM